MHADTIVTERDGSKWRASSRELVGALAVCGWRVSESSGMPSLLSPLLPREDGSTFAQFCYRLQGGLMTHVPGFRYEELVFDANGRAIVSDGLRAALIERGRADFRKKYPTLGGAA